MSQPAIVEEFLELVCLNVNSRRERPMADVLAAKLKVLGFTVEEDRTGEKIGGEAGNLIARLAGDPARPALLFSAHMDRVENHGRIVPLVEGGIIKSDGTSILGADDASGICAILAGVRQALAEGAAHGDIEIDFSVAEEVGLLGARHLDYSRISAKMAYVIDTCGPLNAVTNQAPTQYRLLVKVRGRSAHAGLEPEKGLSAIRVAAVALSRLREGRLSPATTSNFGVMQAGTATNIVCDYAEIRGEARSRRPEELDAYLAEVKAVFAEVAEEFGTVIEVESSREYSTYLVEESEPVLRLAGRALRNLGLKMEVAASGGGSDGNYFNQNGIKAVGLSPGYTGVHTPGETQPVTDLIQCGRLVAELIKEAAKG